MVMPGTLCSRSASSEAFPPFASPFYTARMYKSTASYTFFQLFLWLTTRKKCIKYPTFYEGEDDI